MRKIEIAIRVKKMKHTVLIEMHRTKIRKGVANVLWEFEGCGSKTFFEGSAPSPTHFSFRMALPKLQCWICACK